MFIDIFQSSLNETNKIGANMIKGWLAVDTENFAFIKQTAGRGKGGLPKFYMVVPCTKPEKLEDALKFGYNIGNQELSIIRAWTLQEAIEIANKRLPKLLKKARSHEQRI